MWLKGDTLKRLAFGDQRKDTVRMEAGQDRLVVTHARFARKTLPKELSGGQEKFAD